MVMEFLRKDCMILGTKKVNYYQNGLNSLINFDFKGDANKSYEEIFSNYDQILHADLSGNTVMNYISSHDDGDPFDKERKRNYEAGNQTSTRSRNFASLLRRRKPLEN